MRSILMLIELGMISTLMDVFYDYLHTKPHNSCVKCPVILQMANMSQNGSRDKG